MWRIVLYKDWIKGRTLTHRDHSHKLSGPGVFYCPVNHYIQQNSHCLLLETQRKQSLHGYFPHPASATMIRQGKASYNKAQVFKEGIKIIKKMWWYIDNKDGNINKYENWTLNEWRWQSVDHSHSQNCKKKFR